MPLLEARELRAVGALGEVVSKAAALLASQSPVDRPRDGQLRLGARELVLELFGERAARAEEQRLERADVVTPRISAISEYDRPSNSRRTIACRCCGGIFESAVRSSPTLGPSSSDSCAGDPVVELDRDAVAPAPGGIAA